MKIEVVQGFQSLFEKEKNIKFLMKRMEKSSADLLIFGELFLTGYSIMDHMHELAERRDGKVIKAIVEKARETGKNVIFGMIEEDELVKGVYYNSAFFVDREGNVDSYRKISLPNFGPFNEKRSFKEGNEVKIFNVNDSKVGVLICYDLFFPELSGALLGCDLLVYLSASPYTSREQFERLLYARAIETSSYVVYANLAGREENLLFWGGSRGIDPFGKDIAKAKYFENEIINFEIETENLSWMRLHRPVIRDGKD